jgi:two-component system sensor histidine kinase ChvG
VQRFRAVRGALLLSTQGGDIDQAVEAERLQIVKLFGILLGVMVVLSTAARRTIAGPVSGSPKRRARAPPHPLARRNPDFTAAATRSAICPARCAT